MSTDQPAHAPQELRSWAADAFGSEYALSPIQLAIGGAVLDSVWSQGIAEGRRQATEGVSADLAVVLNQRVMHSHQRPGVWDDENPPDRAGKPCVECAARARLARLVGPWEPAEQPEGSDRG